MSLMPTVQSAESRNSKILLGTVEGLLACLDGQTGAFLWSIDTGGPLITKTDNTPIQPFIPSLSGDNTWFRLAGQNKLLKMQHTFNDSIIQSHKEGYLVLQSKSHRYMEVDVISGNLIDDENSIQVIRYNTTIEGHNKKKREHWAYTIGGIMITTDVMGSTHSNTKLIENGQYLASIANTIQYDIKLVVDGTTINLSKKTHDSQLSWKYKFPTPPVVAYEYSDLGVVEIPINHLPYNVDSKDSSVPAVILKDYDGSKYALVNKAHELPSQLRAIEYEITESYESNDMALTKWTGDGNPRNQQNILIRDTNCKVFIPEIAPENVTVTDQNSRCGLIKWKQYSDSNDKMDSNTSSVWSWASLLFVVPCIWVWSRLPKYSNLVEKYQDCRYERPNRLMITDGNEGKPDLEKENNILKNVLTKASSWNSFQVVPGWFRKAIPNCPSIQHYENKRLMITDLKTKNIELEEENKKLRSQLEEKININTEATIINSIKSNHTYEESWASSLSQRTDIDLKGGMASTFFRSPNDDDTESEFSIVDTKSKGRESNYKSNYEEISQIGNGAFGAVYHVRSKVDKKEYAVKKIRIPSKANERDLEKVIREAVVLAKLDDIHVVRYYTSWIDESEDNNNSNINEKSNNSIENSMSSEFSSTEKDEDSNSTRLFYIFMEYCNGGTLADRYNDYCKAKAPINEIEMLYTFRQLVNGLQAVHSQGILHRDLKPSNIFITRNGILKIGDFGLSCSQSDPSSPISKSSWISDENMTTGIGSPHYSAPEQFGTSAGFYDEKADIFSLGVIIYEGFLRPDTASERIKLLGMVRNRHIPDELMQNHKPIMDLILKMTHKNPNKRPDLASIKTWVDSFKIL